MLLRRVAKSKLRHYIKLYLGILDNEKLPENLALKKAFKTKSKDEIVEELIFYIEYSLKNTANPDEHYINLLKKLLDKCKKKDLGDIKGYIEKLK